MQKRKLPRQTESNDSKQQDAQPDETVYERQMRLMREIGKTDKAILAALAK